MQSEPVVLTKQCRQRRTQTVPPVKSPRTAFLTRQLISSMHARCVSDTRTHQRGRLLCEVSAACSDSWSLRFSRPTSNPNTTYALHEAAVRQLDRVHSALNRISSRIAVLPPSHRSGGSQPGPSKPRTV